MAASISILVVDDQPCILDGLALVLTEAGYHVSTASDGIEALSMLHTQTIDLILSDVVLPRMSGYQLLKVVRENQQWQTIPFVFLTALDLEGSEVEQGMNSIGGEVYLGKPVEPEELLEAVRRILQRSYRAA